jgi:hypothetical protein
MTTAIEIANMALSLIGSANRITVLDGNGSEENRQCFLHYEPARDALLRSHSWNFAVTRVKITTTAAGAPPFGYANWFTLPADCLRVLSVNDDAYEYKVEGGRVLTNSTPIDLKYVKAETDATKYDSQFVQLLALALAIRISVKLSDNANLKESLKADFRDMIRDARTFDAQEGGTPDGLYADGWINSRA